MEINWNLQVPDDGAGGAYISGYVRDYERVKSGAYDPALEHIHPRSISQEPLAYGEPGPADRLVQDPSFRERVNQALLQSVGDAGSRYRVPKEYLIGGVALVAAGVLLSTLWADVTVVEEVAVGFTPSGGVLASRSFGW